MQNLSKNNEFKKLTYAGKAGNSKKQTRNKQETSKKKT
jgi:hypothetical protein